MQAGVGGRLLLHRNEAGEQIGVQPIVAAYVLDLPVALMPEVFGQSGDDVEQFAQFLGRST